MILVDDRAGSVNLIPLLPPELCKQMRLEAGDAAFFGYGPDGPLTYPIGIEYKTAKEALQSMLNRRLVGEQLPKMSTIYKRVYVLIEGEYREGSNGLLEHKSWKQGKPNWTAYSKVPYRSFDNWLNSLAEVAHVVIKRSLDRNESAAQILDLYHYWTHDYAEHKTLMAFDSSQTPTLLIKPSTKRLVAAQLPGVGYELSGRVSEQFPTILEMVNAGEDQWSNVKGIGKKKAQLIVKALRS